MLVPEMIDLLWAHAQCYDSSKEQHWKCYAQVINKQINRSRRGKSLAGDYADDSDVDPTYTGGSHKGKERSKKEIVALPPAGDDTMDIFLGPIRAEDGRASPL